jgi:hypothetical protein
MLVFSMRTESFEVISKFEQSMFTKFVIILTIIDCLKQFFWNFCLSILSLTTNFEVFIYSVYCQFSVVFPCFKNFGCDVMMFYGN